MVKLGAVILVDIADTGHATDGDAGNRFYLLRRSKVLGKAKSGDVKAIRPRRASAILTDQAVVHFQNQRGA